MKIIPFFYALVLLALPFIFSACWAAVGAGAGAGTMAYIDGSVTDTLDANMNVSHKAVLKAMQDLKLTTTSDSMDELNAEVIARDSRDEKIKIELEKLTESATKVSIRVGLFGDQSLSVDILGQIKKNLK